MISLDSGVTWPHMLDNVRWPKAGIRLISDRARATYPLHDDRVAEIATQIQLDLGGADPHG
jgi:hypothetical protein